ncbi:putative orfan [Tupanvirus soda lake]|uniref:Orfan n=2 Tax=Tupanvirus TaxID=2094720 RepID=A0AC62ADC1_9VIRU|nr:putative orfan [Tupanvirus soda lake]QKU35712.1 putative orfan [Tupanvirus soda lake]
MKGLLLTAFFFTTLYMNLYKFPIMYHLRQGEHYPIFPWSLDPSPSMSSGIWLMAHLFSALVTVIVSTIMVAIGYTHCTPFFRRIQRTIYIVFALTILINIHHFGTASVPVAIAANGTPLLVSFYGMLRIEKYNLKWGGPMRRVDNNNNFYFVVHYVGIIIPILFELGMRLMQLTA